MRYVIKLSKIMELSAPQKVHSRLEEDFHLHICDKRILKRQSKFSCSQRFHYPKIIIELVMSTLYELVSLKNKYLDFQVAVEGSLIMILGVILQIMRFGMSLMNNVALEN